MKQAIRDVLAEVVRAWNVASERVMGDCRREEMLSDMTNAVYAVVGQRLNDLERELTTVRERERNAYRETANWEEKHARVSEELQVAQQEKQIWRRSADSYAEKLDAVLAREKKLREEIEAVMMERNEAMRQAEKAIDHDTKNAQILSENASLLEQRAKLWREVEILKRLISAMTASLNEFGLYVNLAKG